MQVYRFAVLAAALGALPALAGPAAALSASECSVKYRAAKDGGTLGGMKWNEFRRAECGAAQTSTTVSNPLEPGSARTAPPQPSPAAAPVKPRAAAPASGGAGAYPAAVDPKYASETPGKARMHTCLDRYRANKASGAGADLAWIVKGGGYYSECNKRLKG